jgi:hypothetical protein
MNGFSREITIRSTPSFGGEVKPEDPGLKIFKACEKSLASIKKILGKAKFSFLSHIPLA